VVTPRPPHIRARMIRRIATQIAALPIGGHWQIDERLAGLLGWSVPVSARAIQWELDRLITLGCEIRCVITHAVEDDRELHPVAIFGKPQRCAITGQVLG